MIFWLHVRIRVSYAGTNRIRFKGTSEHIGVSAAFAAPPAGSTG